MAFKPIPVPRVSAPFTYALQLASLLERIIVPSPASPRNTPDYAARLYKK